MATGDVTMTLVGIYATEDLKAGVDGQNEGTQDWASRTADLVFVGIGNGQIAVYKRARAA